MNIHSVAASDCGKCRENNEDHYLIDESLGLYIVCDGMGGHSAGEVAAERCVAYASEFIRERREVLENANDSPDGYFRVLELAEEATQETSRLLYEVACSNAGFAGMGTTMTMLLIVDNKAVMAHVGDSRLYMLRSGELHQLSSDHTLANEMVHAGNMTPEEAASSKFIHVLTRTIGQQKMVQVESLLFDLFADDTLLLCSDGLSNYFEDRTVVTQFLASKELTNLPGKLIEFANSRGGDDNITTVILRSTADAKDADATFIQHRIDTLKSTFLCRKFRASWLMRVLNITSLIKCGAGQRLLSVGQKCEGLYIVLDGRLTIDDDSVLSGDLLPGDCLGETSLLREGKIHVSVTSEEPSSLLLIPRSKFGKLTRRLPKLGSALLRNLGLFLSEQLDDTQSNDDTNPGDTAKWDRDSPQ